MVRRTMSAVIGCLAIAAVDAGAVAQTASDSEAAAKEVAKKTKSAAQSDGASASPISLEGSLKPLVERFNAAKGKHRFVALLSPT